MEGEDNRTEAIFLSYSAADRRWAAWIRAELDRAGYEVVPYESDLASGSVWKLELEAELAQFGPAFAIVSPDYLALLRGRPLRDFLPPQRLAALRVREFEASQAIEGVELVDLVGLDEESASERVVKAAELVGSAATQRVGRRRRESFPGSLAPIWGVPYGRNLQFLGRTDQLAEMHEALQRRGVVALTGVAGVGKTQLALEYSYKYAADYSLVWWVRAENPEWLRNDVAELEERLEVTGDHGAIRRWLGRRDQWLLVIDEIADPAELPTILRRFQKGHVIVTSLNPNWEEHAHVIAVPVLRRAEAVEYLLGSVNESESEEAAAVADLVGNLPAALRAVAETTRSADVSLKDLRASLEPDAPPGGEVRAKLTPAIKDQLRILRADSPGALELLEVMAFFAPDDIPLVLFEDWEPSDEKEAEPESEISEGLVEKLRDYGFVTVRSDGVSVNRLVRVAARDALPDEQARRRAESALGIVSEGFAYQVEYNENWSTTARMLPHALRVARHAERLGADPATTSWLLNQVGLYHLQRANYAEAVEVLRRALSLGEQIFGPSALGLGVVANNLGSALQNLGELEEAEELARRSVSILETAEDGPRPELGISLSNLGSVLRDRKDFLGARHALERSIEIETAARGPDDPVIALRLNDLARVLREKGDLLGARDQLERARKLVEDRVDLDTPRIAPILWNLGEVRRELGDLVGSRNVLEQTLAMVEGWYGPSHPEVAKHSRSLGLTLFKTGELDQAQVMLKRALAIDEGTFGPDHPAVLADSEALQAVLMQQARGVEESRQGAQ